MQYSQNYIKVICINYKNNLNKIEELLIALSNKVMSELEIESYRLKEKEKEAII